MKVVTLEDGNKGVWLSAGEFGDTFAALRTALQYYDRLDKNILDVEKADLSALVSDAAAMLRAL